MLAEALESGSITLNATRSHIASEFAHGPKSLERMTTIIVAWRKGGGTEGLLAATLRGHLELLRAVENRGPRCELVWTGDTPVGATVRSTLAVVREMLTLARRSVLVVTYSLWAGMEAATVIDLLAQRSSAGVDVTFVLDARYQDGWNIAELKRRWPTGRRRPELYTWQDTKDTVAKLHAKVVLVDDRDLLITSANLTGHGMSHNLEFGVRVHGDPAEDASTHLNSLIRIGVFEHMPW